MTWTEAVVVSHFLATPDVAVIDLAPGEGAEFPAYTAGAHIDVLTDSGLVRQYSLCGPPESGRYRLAVLNEPRSRGGSRAMHALRVGDRLRISAPRNRFPLVTAQRHLLIAGGIGITPLLAMVRHLEQAGGDYTLHYCARSRARAAFVSELTGNPRVAFHFDDEHPEQMLDMERDLGGPYLDTAAYVCGPAGFMDYVLGQAEALGWPPHVLHKERFSSARPVSESGTAGSGGFTVRLASTGDEYLVPEGRSVLDVLLEKGVDAPYSCQQGICGDCVVRVLAGDPDHRDEVLTADERAEGMFATCSSRAHSPILELDL
ncbi:vanillate O-demethylase ferredoxin subunit [Streptomyces sp. SAI-144]|uniref:PDR/VanB family oxidoreductase n=1 Tax=unclassified Streptomyces TaxID=2593676 RepID=UPI0024748290|nr:MULTISPECIES: PDR/VanB family oxidoreductase [unclassified Streptomyces]MDH6437103.1 vanillate O-demethylase ferredoxin subunit [Streptomyces sp. SAI-144]MDH6484529.1 vanillate O-demethylase ferredoxin subunit [Streptomyces sp. SAI-127]